MLQLFVSSLILRVLSVAISTMIQCHLVEEEVSNKILYARKLSTNQLFILCYKQLYPEGSSYVTYELDKFLKDIDIH